LKTLAWLPLRRLRTQKQQSKSRTIIKAAPTTDPTATPAICPPVNPLLWLAPLLGEGVLWAVGVADGKSGGKEVCEGSVTPGQRLFTFEPTQHESVAFGELVAQ